MTDFDRLSFCPELQRLYETRVAIGRSGKPSPYTGSLSTVNNLLAIRRVLLQRRPAKTLEIGLACGASALTFAATLRELGQAPAKQHVAIDAFQKGYDDVGRIQLINSGLDGYVDVLENLSVLELPKLVSSSSTFEVVYVDGSHRFEDVFCDFYFIRFLLPIGGIVMFDDSSDPNVAKVIKFIRNNLADGFRQIPIHEVRETKGIERYKLAIAERLYRTQLSVFERIGGPERSGKTRLARF